MCSSVRGASEPSTTAAVKLRPDHSMNSNRSSVAAKSQATGVTAAVSQTRDFHRAFRPNLQFLLSVMVCQLVYSFRPCSEFSQPMPDCLCPPNA